MSLLAPLGLLLGTLSLPLVALYFLKIRRRRVVVPSILPWHELAKSERLASPFQRFQKSLLLLLQLLLLLLLTLAFARPFLDADVAPERSVVLVIDTTASMGSKDGDPTRLASAVAQAKDVVARMGDDDEAMVVVAGAGTEVRVPFTRDKGALDAGLDAIATTEAEGSLAEGLELALSLARSRPGVEVIVYSDGGNEDLSQVPTGGAPIKYVPVGKGDVNAGIVALDIRRSPASDTDRQLFVTVEDFGSQPVDASVEVYLEGNLVGLRTESLKPATPDAMVFDLPPRAEGKLDVHVDAPGDLLAADDHAYAVVAATATERVLLVGSDVLTARALAADPRFDLKAVSAAAFTPATMDGFDCAVFGQMPPGGLAALDGRNYAVLTSADGGPAKLGGEVKAPVVMGFRRTHPVLRFVGWDGVAIARSREVTDQGGLTSIVDGDGGPLVLAGERAGGRVVELTFQPLESDLPLRVAWPVFLLNTVGWLTEDAQDDGAKLVATGSPYVRRLPDGADPSSVAVTGPDGKSLETEVGGGVLRVRDTSKAGLYTVRVGSKTSTFAADLLSDRESRIAPQTSLTIGTATAAPATDAAVLGRRELWRPILIAALVVLCLEWVLWNRRRVA